jgi:hypothetical protein
MIHDVATFQDVVTPENFPRRFPATCKAAFMVAPIGFSLDRQTAQDNRYMRMQEAADPTRALQQQMELARRIGECGVPVVTFPGSPETPDAVFPNNAFATHHGQRGIIGHMRHPNRQKETRRADIRRFFSKVLGYRLFDLSNEDVVAELTGVMVPDRARNIGFVGMTERVDEAGARAMAHAFGLDALFQFDLQPDEYHANVVMAILAGRALVIHAGSFADPAVPRAIADFYGEHSIFLSDEEKQAFAGNCISLTESDVFFSQTALDALRPENRQKLENWGFRLHGVDVNELEKAGGSLRCMIGEIF